ncbi:MAG: N-acetyltransferase [Alphaproteobacteria bacterium]|nr:N-acetyltransferase [Alphaproteobacteria bacterium]
MTQAPVAIRLRAVEAIGAIDAARWDACAGATNPFVSHAFLLALEESGCIGGRTGWLARHVVAEDAEGGVVACAPLYLKAHSQGEYVFDHGWAEAWQRAGGRYYPKLLCAVPFSPVPGPRLLLRDPADGVLRATLARGLVALAEEGGVSSLHANFCTPEDAEAFRAAGMLLRTGFQFHWENRGYASFEGFLGALSHSKRKSIRKERREVAATGVELATLRGDELDASHWDAFFGFYMATADRKWGRPYLNRDFFARLHATLRDRVALVMGRHEGGWVAGALNLVGADALYGRNWGATADFKHLHFEACYYRAIEYAIAHGIARVEAGAQGEHKLQRGYLPVRTFSAHWIRDEGFRAAVDDFVGRETRAVDDAMAEYSTHSPFRQA